MTTEPVPSGPGTVQGAPDYYRKRIENWLSGVRFKRRLVGGLDEADVWKKLQDLNGMYEEALRAERARYEELLAQKPPKPPDEDTRHEET